MEIYTHKQRVVQATTTSKKGSVGDILKVISAIRRKEDAVEVLIEMSIGASHILTAECTHSSTSLIVIFIMKNAGFPLQTERIASNMTSRSHSCRRLLRLPLGRGDILLTLPL